MFLLALAAATVTSALGVRPDASLIECRLTADDLDYHTSKTRLLVIGAAPQAKPRQRGFSLSVVPSPAPAAAYPPTGDAYGGPNAEAAYLWRWIGMHAPDLVVEYRPGGPRAWYLPPDVNLPLQPQHRLAPSSELVSQLGRLAPSGTGTIPALRVHGDPDFLPALLTALQKAKFRGPSPARKEIQRRLARSPLEVARQLAAVYGHDLDQAVYIPALALVGRLRLGELADVERIVAPYLSGARPSLPNPPTGSHFSGHLVFGELFRLTSKPRYLELVRRAAGSAFDERGNPKPAMPYHSEMSDAVFMSCPILAQAGRLSGDPKYYDMSLRHMKFMLDLNLRPDGLHRHSPLDPTAWGRGNGFPAWALPSASPSCPSTTPAAPRCSAPSAPTWKPSPATRTPQAPGIRSSMSRAATASSPPPA